MHIFFVNYADFRGPSGIHIFHLAHALNTLGVPSTILVPKRPESAAVFGQVNVMIASYAEAESLARQQKPCIIHAWTPRESTRWMTARLSHLHGIPYVVHLEDNEDAILSSYFDVSIPLRTWRRLRLSLNPKERPLPHPKRYKEFISNASGATVLIEELKDFVPTHVPTTVIWPACEDYISNMPLEPNLSLREQLGIPRHHLVLTYPGNVHQNNLQDVEDLYQAVRLCRKRNLCVSLIRIGRNYVPLNRDFSDDEGTCFVELGEIPPKDIPRFVQAADILVQPGRNTPFNHYRFPSKLPMFLASGRPVILGYTSVAKQLSHGRNAIILAENTPEEIAEAIEMLAESPEERIRLGNAGRKFAREQFSWKR